MGQASTQPITLEQSTFAKLTYLYSLVDIATKRQDLDLYLG